MTQIQINKAVSEIKEVIEGSRIERISQLDHYSFVLFLYSRGQTFSLLISVLKRSVRFHFLFEKIQKEHLFTSPAAGVLTSHTVKGRIRSLHLYESCIELTIEQRELRRLIVDFAAYNVLLYNEEGTALFMLHKKKIPEKVSRVQAESMIQADGGPGNDEGRYFFNLDLSGEDRLPFNRELSGGDRLPFNRELSEEFFSERNAHLKHRVMKVMKSENKKVLRLIVKLDSEKEAVDHKERCRMAGELIKCNLSGIKKGSSSVLLKDFEGENVAIDLNPKLSLQENMNYYFKEYKKLKRKEGKLGQKLCYEHQRLDALTALIGRGESSDCISLAASPSSFLSSLDRRFFKEGMIRRLKKAFSLKTEVKKVKREGSRTVFLHFSSASGKAILVGRNARENEELSIRKARGNDLWFHVESGQGSHVVLRYDKMKEFREDDVLDAAVLALYFSKSRAQGSGNVVYTRCKWVKKPKHTKEGYVTYYNNKTKHIVLNEKILARLLDSKIPMWETG